jgi:hypothetical protein
MDKHVEGSLERIIEYLFSDELRHWQEQGEPMNHIFIDVWRVDRWLKKLRAEKRRPRNRR